MAVLGTDNSSQLKSAAPSAFESRGRMNALLLLVGLSVLINYIDRSNLSIAASLIKDELKISASQLGMLLSAFFWTYALMQIPAGWLVDRFDVKWVFAFGFFIWSASTAVTGILHGFAALLAIRVILGLGESVAFPSCAKILGTHFHGSRRGVANAVVAAGLSLGPALGMFVGGTVVGRFGWRPFFLALGLLGLLWLGPWVLVMPRRTAAPHRKHHAGLLHILRHQPVWGTCVGLFALNYALYFLVTWLPFYLVRGRGLAMGQMARVGGLVFLVAALSALAAGKLADRWVALGHSAGKVHKGMVVVGSLGLGAFLVVSVVAPANLFIWTLVCAGFFEGMIAGNLWAITQIMAGPRLVGRWVGVQNFIGNFAGVVAPWLTGYLLDRTGLYRWSFFVTAAVLGVGALSWIFLVGPVQEVNWEKSSAGMVVPAYSATEARLP